MIFYSTIIVVVFFERPNDQSKKVKSFIEQLVIVGFEDELRVK